MSLTLFSDRTIDGNLYHRTSLPFDGTTQYVNVPHATNLNTGTSDFTVNMWIYPKTGFDSSDRGIIGKRTSGTTAGWSFRVNTGTSQYEFVTIDSSLTTDVRKTIPFSALTINQWYMVTLVRVGNSLSDFRIHVNASANIGSDFLSGATLSGDSSVNNTEPLTIGAQFPTSDKWNGEIAEAQLYDIALTQDQINRLYAKGSGTSPHNVFTSTQMLNDLRFWMKFDNQQLYTNEIQVPDMSTTKANGTLTGYTLDYGTISPTGKTYTPFFVDKWQLPTGAQVGNGLKLDGTNDFISITHSSSLAGLGAIGNWSISCWTRLDTLPSSNSVVWSKRVTTGTTRGVMLSARSSAHTDTFSVDFFDSVSLLVLTGNTYSISDIGKWFHHVIVANGSNIQLWQNGVQVASGTLSASVDNTANLIIGDWQGNRFSNNTHADFQIYNKTLSSGEIAQIYGNRRVITPSTTLQANLVGYYNFAETPTSTTVTDRSGNSNNGTLSGFTSLNYSTSNKARTSLASDLNDDVIVDTPYKWCASFTGGANSISIPGSVAYNFGTNPFSVSFWVNMPLIFPAAGLNDFLSYQSTSNSTRLSYLSSVNRLLINIRFSSANNSVYNRALIMLFNTNFPVGKWCHVFYNISNIQSDNMIFINGIRGTFFSDLSATPLLPTDPINLSTGLIYLCNNSASLNQGSPNKLTNVQFFNRALTSSEVSELASRHLVWGGTPASAQSSLVGKWLLNDIEGTNVRDFSTNANNGTVNNAGAGTNLNGGFWLKEGPDNRFI
jgi:hypothetical protein